MQDDDLNKLFDAARAQPPQVPEALTARVMADAQAAQSGAGWRSWFASLGGLPGIGGLITATCVGFWIGVAPPQGLPDLAGLVLGQDVTAISDDESSLYGWSIEEG